MILVACWIAAMALGVFTLRRLGRWLHNCDAAHLTERSNEVP